MGFTKRQGIFRVKCDVCDKTASGNEDILIDEGWSWGRLDLTVNGERKQVNYAGCPEHDGSSMALETLKELEEELGGNHE